MKTPNDLWDDIGSLSEDEMFHVITKLFAIYETQFGRDPDNTECRNFFNNLDNVISQTMECNSNRR
jgi:hypothetical protein